MGVHRAIRGQGQVDDTAYVDPSAYVSHSALVSIKAFVDRGAFIGDNAYIGLRTIVGAGAHIGAGAFIGADVIICDKARIADAAVIVDGSTVLSDCCCDGGGSGGQDVPVLTFDSINVVGDKLAAYITTGKKKGTLAYVGNDSFAGQFSVKAYFVLVYGENLTADGLTVVNSPTFGTDGAQWLRQDTVNEQALQKNFWAIDPVGGNDENTGWGINQAAADAVPLKTMAELNRRLYGYKAGDASMSLAPVYHILGNVPAADSTVMTNLRGVNGNATPLFQGRKTQSGGDFVVTAFATAVPAANTGYLLSAVGLGTQVNTVLGAGGRAMIQNAAGTHTAWALEVISANQVRVSCPTNADVVAFTFAKVNFTVAETVRVFTLPSLPNYPFSPDMIYAACQDVEIRGSLDGSGSFDLANMGMSQPFLFRCLFNGMNQQGGCEGIVSTCLFSKHNSNVAQTSNVYTSCAIDRVTLFVLDLASAFEQTLDISGANAQLRTGQSAKVPFTDGTLVSVFNTTTAALFVSVNCSMELPAASSLAAVYGQGNTGFILQSASMCQVRLPKANCFATSAVSPLSIVGISHPYADIPIYDVPSQSYVIE